MLWLLDIVTCAWKKGGILQLVFGASNAMTLDTPSISCQIHPFFQAQIVTHDVLTGKATSNFTYF